MEKINIPDITYMLHQCTQLSKDPRKPHGEDVKRIGIYLKRTEKWAYISALKTVTSRYGRMLISLVIVFQRKLIMICIRNVLAQYLLYYN